MSSLSSSTIRDLLDRLYGEAERNDSRVLPRVQAEAALRAAPFDDREFASLLDEAFIPLAPEVGRFVYVLVRMRRPKLAVEFGASFGLSAIHIAAALKDNGQGRLITTECNARKAERAMEHLKEAGLAEWVEVRQGDAFETLGDPGSIEFLLLDGWKALYLPLLRKLEPVLAPGALVVADDLKIMPEMLAPYLGYVRDPQNGYISCEVPLDDGLELSLRG